MFDDKMEKVSPKVILVGTYKYTIYVDNYYIATNDRDYDMSVNIVLSVNHNTIWYIAIEVINSVGYISVKIMHRYCFIA